ncbi:hypothetical protein B4U79_18228 [Dinothrombium tinctorium]|uniref:Peptidase M13 N-terminal domain-containing protein n=1 Tax=Dinothrombium tinctorium TaxID=1965070 RepID=A0A443QVT6_9ACAR|nr:hypothetical protein B4U79_18228 [Dinothrombium tinctorium]
MPKYEKIALKLYDDCLHQDSTEMQKNNGSNVALMRLLKKIGGWPMIQSRWNFNFVLERVYGYIRSTFGLNWIFGVYMYTEADGNALRTILYLDAPSFVVERKLLYSPLTDNKRLDSLNAYKSYIRSVALLLNEDTSLTIKQLNADIEAMIEFEASLMNIASDENSKNTRAIQIKDLNRRYPKVCTELLNTWM